MICLREFLLDGLRRRRGRSSRVEGEHHAHIFVFEIVAVKDKRSFEGSESHEDFSRASTVEDHGITLEAIRTFGSFSIERLYRVGFKMDVDGMPPASPLILEDPSLGRP